MGVRLTVENASREAGTFLSSIGSADTSCRARGIVTCAGGVRYLTCAWVLIHALRRIGCALPIEVWYLDDDEGDPEWIELLRSLNVRCLNMAEHRRANGAETPTGAARHPRYAGWAAKSYAILNSGFREVLFLDADNVPVVDPTFLFDCPQYQRTGVVFWPDGSRMKADEPAWQAFGVPYRDELDIESGQLMFDKGRAWRALSLANWFNERAEFFYRYVYGDKDTFRFACHRVGQPFAMPARSLDLIPFTIRQYDFDDRLLFQHRFADKWSLDRNRRSKGFLFESECLEWIDDLRQRWNPVPHLTRRIGPADRRRIEELAGRRFHFSRVGRNGWSLTLAADGHVGQGRSENGFFWWCDDGQIVFAGSDGKPACRMAPVADARWEGRFVREPHYVARLERQSPPTCRAPRIGLAAAAAT